MSRRSKAIDPLKQSFKSHRFPSGQTYEGPFSVSSFFKEGYVPENFVDRVTNSYGKIYRRLARNYNNDMDEDNPLAVGVELTNYSEMFSDLAGHLRRLKQQMQIEIETEEENIEDQDFALEDTRYRLKDALEAMTPDVEALQTSVSHLSTSSMNVGVKLERLTYEGAVLRDSVELLQHMNLFLASSYDNETAEINHEQYLIELYTSLDPIPMDSFEIPGLPHCQSILQRLHTVVMDLTTKAEGKPNHASLEVLRDIVLNVFTKSTKQLVDRFKFLLESIVENRVNEDDYEVYHECNVLIATFADRADTNMAQIALTILVDHFMKTVKLKFDQTNAEGINPTRYFENFVPCAKVGLVYSKLADFISSSSTIIHEVFVDGIEYIIADLVTKITYRIQEKLVSFLEDVKKTSNTLFMHYYVFSVKKLSDTLNSIWRNFVSTTKNRTVTRPDFAGDLARALRLSLSTTFDEIIHTICFGNYKDFFSIYELAPLLSKEMERIYDHGLVYEESIVGFWGEHPSDDSGFNIFYFLYHLVVIRLFCMFDKTIPDMRNKVKSVIGLSFSEMEKSIRGYATDLEYSRQTSHGVFDAKLFERACRYANMCSDCALTIYCYCAFELRHIASDHIMKFIQSQILDIVPSIEGIVEGLLNNHHKQISAHMGYIFSTMYLCEDYNEVEFSRSEKVLRMYNVESSSSLQNKFMSLDSPMFDEFRVVLPKVMQPLRGLSDETRISFQTNLLKTFETLLYDALITNAKKKILISITGGMRLAFHINGFVAEFKNLRISGVDEIITRMLSVTKMFSFQREQSIFSASAAIKEGMNRQKIVEVMKAHIDYHLVEENVLLLAKE
ncbi:hypothetical protein PCE1_001633 [Barthelona sp. PCE]